MAIYMAIVARGGEMARIWTMDEVYRGKMTRAAVADQLGYEHRSVESLL